MFILLLILKPFCLPLSLSNSDLGLFCDYEYLHYTFDSESYPPNSKSTAPDFRDIETYDVIPIGARVVIFSVEECV